MLEIPAALLVGSLLTWIGMRWWQTRVTRAQAPAPPAPAPVCNELPRNLSAVAGSVGHEFANLSSGIEGHAQLLCEAMGEPAQIAERAEQLWSAVRRLRLFSEKLLACASPLPRATEPVELGPLLGGLQHEMEAHLGGGFQVTIRASEALPPVLGDPTALRNAILFFVDAVLGIEPDAATVVISATPDLDEDEEPGVDLELQVESESGSRVVSDRDLASELGFRACENLLAAYGAELRVDHLAGLSTVASIRMRAADEPVAEPDEHEGPSVQLSTHPYGGVLIAESDPTLREMIATELAPSGRNLFVCPNGSHARELFQRTPAMFELLILEQDARLWPGDELALEALADPRAPDVHVLLLGNGRDPSVAQQARPDRCLRIDKPFGLMELRDALASLVALPVGRG